MIRVDSSKEEFDKKIKEATPVGAAATSKRKKKVAKP